MSNEIDDKEDAVLKVPAEFAHLLAGMPTDFEVVDVEIVDEGDKEGYFFHRLPAQHLMPRIKGFSNWMLCTVDREKTGKFVAVSLKAKDRAELESKLVQAIHVSGQNIVERAALSVNQPKGLNMLAERANPGPLISSCSSYENVQVEAGIGPEAVNSEPEADDISLDDDEVRTEIISHIMKGANEDVLASRTMIAELKADWPFELEAKN